jgi:hypothetical protein
VHHLRNPLDNKDEERGKRINMSKAHFLLHVVQGVWGVDGKAYEDNVRIRITQRAETVIVLLSSGIPQSQLNMLAINFDIGNIVLKNRRDVDLGFTVRLCSARAYEKNDLGECALRKDDQKAGLHKGVRRKE